MPLVLVVMTAGFLASAVLGFVAAGGWVSIRARVEAGKGNYESSNADLRDLCRVWAMSVVGGMAITVAGLIVAWKMGVDLWGLIGG